MGSLCLRPAELYHDRNEQEVQGGADAFVVVVSVYCASLGVRVRCILKVAFVDDPLRRRLTRAWRSVALSFVRRLIVGPSWRRSGSESKPGSRSGSMVGPALTAALSSQLSERYSGRVKSDVATQARMVCAGLLSSAGPGFYQKGFRPARPYGGSWTLPAPSLCRSTRPMHSRLAYRRHLLRLDSKILSWLNGDAPRRMTSPPRPLRPFGRRNRDARRLRDDVESESIVRLPLEVFEGRKSMRRNVCHVT